MLRTMVIWHCDANQYDVITLFQQALIDALEKTDAWQIFLVSYDQDLPKLLQEVEQLQPDVIICFNGIVLQADVLRCDIFRHPELLLISIFVDHPVHHPQRIFLETDQIQAKLLHTFIDASHLTFLQHCQLDAKIQRAFLPHAACSNTSNCTGFADRSIDVLFCGSYYDLEETSQLIEQQPIALQDILHRWIAVAVKQEQIYFEDIVLADAKQHGLSLSQETWPAIALLLKIVDDYVVAHRRIQVLTYLQQCNIRVTLIGNHWECSPFIRTHRVLGEMPYTTAIEYMRQAKIILNISGNYPKGGHERIFEGIMQGAVIASDDSDFLQQEFVEGQEIILYHHLNYDPLADQIKNIIQDSQRWQLMQQNCLQKVVQRHTWQQRSQELLALIEMM